MWCAIATATAGTRVTTTPIRRASASWCMTTTGAGAIATTIAGTNMTAAAIGATASGSRSDRTQILKLEGGAGRSPPSACLGGLFELNVDFCACGKKPFRIHAGKALHIRENVNL